VCKVHAQALVYAPERLLQLQGVVLTADAAGVVLVVEADACNSAAVAAAEPPCTYNSSTNAQALVFAPERLLQMQGVALTADAAGVVLVVEAAACNSAALLPLSHPALTTVARMLKLWCMRQSACCKCKVLG
jgi:hypothetical protein